MIGVETPPMLLPRFITPPRNPARSRVARMDGMTQYRPHQRRKNKVLESRTTTASGFVTWETRKIETVAMTAAMPNKVRCTALDDPPRAFQRSDRYPPTSSPTNPAKK